VRVKGREYRALGVLYRGNQDAPYPKARMLHNDEGAAQTPQRLRQETVALNREAPQRI
jgi:hypothetical protein